MPRRPETETTADHALIKTAAEAGYTVSRRQLRRWRNEQLLPHRFVESRGRGRGVEGIDPPETSDQLLALCGWRRIYPRSADKVAISLWYEGWQVPTQRIRSAVVRGFEREIAKGRIDWGREPLSELEKMSGRSLALQDLDPAEHLTADRLVRDAREDLSLAAFGDIESVNDSLIAGYFQIEAIGQTLPLDDRVGFDAETATRVSDLRRMVEDLRTCTDRELEAVRHHLQLLYGIVHLLPGMPTSESGVDLDEIAPILTEGMSLMVVDSDTRHPEYDAGKLMAAMGSTLAVLRNLEPSRLKISR